MALEVIGAGFGRTGTLSLKAALEQLGFVKCHHMKAVAASNDQVVAWQAIASGEAPDWDRIFDGYRAACDWPSCDHFEALLERYPDARVVLGVRDENRWYESVASTIYAASVEFPRFVGWLVPRVGRFNRMVYATVWDGTFGGRFEDRAHAIQVYRDHIERVKRVVPPEKLLVFEAKDGWEPLCRFLDRPVPAGPFPHLNDAATIHRGLRALRIAKWLLPAALLALVIGWLL